VKHAATAPVPSGNRITTRPQATNATTDEMLIDSWVASLNSEHSRRNFRKTAERFCAALPAGLRMAKVEHVRNAIEAITAGLKAASCRQYTLRVKSLLSYGHELGYLTFNAGVPVKLRSEGNRGAALAKRIISETEVALLVRAAKKPRNRMLIEVAYAGGLRVSEIVALNWDDIIERADKMLQLNIVGKGGVIRNVVLPIQVSDTLRSMRPAGAGIGDPVFTARHGGRMSDRNVNFIVKRAAKLAGVTDRLSPHWLRHAHGSHALDNGATLAEVQTTLGHANVATTSGYLHARPDSSSGLRLDPGIFTRQAE
jgi:integrase/recombinase XerD